MSVRLARQNTSNAMVSCRYTSSVTKTGISRMRSVVSQLASPMDRPGRPIDDCSIAPGAIGTDCARSARRPIRAELGEEPARQLRLDANAVGLVRSRQHAALVVAEAERSAVTVRDE